MTDGPCTHLDELITEQYEVWCPLCEQYLAASRVLENARRSHPTPAESPRTYRVEVCARATDEPEVITGLAEFVPPNNVFQRRGDGLGPDYLVIIGSAAERWTIKPSAYASVRVVAED